MQNINNGIINILIITKLYKYKITCNNYKIITKLIMEIAEEKSLQGKARTFIFLLLNLLGWPVNKTIQVSSTQSTAHHLYTCGAQDRKPRLQQAQQSHDAEG